MTEQLRFVLVRETSLVSPGYLHELAKALERHARLCALAHGLLPPTVDAIEAEEKVSGLYSPIRYRSHSTEELGALGWHEFDPNRNGPAATVMVDRGSGLYVGRQSVPETSAHEVTEALCNPRLNRWMPHPDPSRVGVQVAYETDDPTQAHYAFEVNGRMWQMSSFITPAWFDPAANDPDVAAEVMRTTRFDHAGVLTRPGQVGPEGYVILRARGDDGRWVVWFEDDRGDRFASVPPKGGAIARSKSIGARVKLLIEACAKEDDAAAAS